MGFGLFSGAKPKRSPRKTSNRTYLTSPNFNFETFKCPKIHPFTGNSTPLFPKTYPPPTPTKPPTPTTPPPQTEKTTGLPPPYHLRVNYNPRHIGGREGTTPIIVASQGMQVLRRAFHRMLPLKVGWSSPHGSVRHGGGGNILEPVCPLFWWLNPPKQDLFQSKQRLFGFQDCNILMVERTFLWGI